jgi:CheY-like chemotaxis protein
MDDFYRRVLVVDDNEAIRDIVSKMFSRMGHEVTPVDCAEKGFDLFLKNRFDLVITDFEMPGMNGIDFTTQNEYYEGLTKNISRGGVFIEIRDKFNVGQSIKLVIPATESKQNILRKGEVIHHGFSGFGIKFNGAIENGRPI